MLAFSFLGAAMLLTGWALWVSFTDPTSYGHCDNPHCDKDATVHHGLEEYYCDGCDKHLNGRS